MSSALHSSKKIVVLVHRDDAAFSYFKYLIKLMMTEWEGKGLTVEVVRGTDHFVPADLVIPHLDLTVVPNEYRDFLDQYPVVVNRNVVDISKSKISTNIIGKDDTYIGPVIVKTDCNSGGLPEKRLLSNMYVVRAISSKLSGTIVSTLGRKRADPIAWADIKYIKTTDYPVFSSVEDVPREVFENKHLVVEKFLPEVEGGKYCVRYYFFFGDRAVNKVFRSTEKVVKGSDEVQVEEVPVPDELQVIRQRLGMDYGKLDYVLRDGKVVLLDVNRTPGYPPQGHLRQAQTIAHQLADGIWSKLT
jgi:hypothetical protein